MPAHGGSLRHSRGLCGIFSYNKRPFFQLLTEVGVAALFLKAVTSDTEQARAFVSKNGAIDLEDLRESLDGTKCIAPLVSFNKAVKLGRGIRVRSVVLENCVLHLHMVEEPDMFGQWKVYGVEKE